MTDKEGKQTCLLIFIYLHSIERFKTTICSIRDRLTVHCVQQLPHNNGSQTPR